jgi:predicted RNase H-like nuclease (RuvC/YqgF family)
MRVEDSEGKTPLQLANSDPIKDHLVKTMNQELSESTRENQELIREIEDFSRENENLRNRLDIFQSQMSS